MARPTTSFEGGNIQVTLVDPPTWTVHVTPELKGTSPYRAWFYFRMSNLSPAQPTNMVFQDVAFFTRPYYSYDNVNWTVFPAPSGNMYSVTFTQDPVWIAHSIPYTTSHEQQLIDDVQGPHVRTSVLATSEGGRSVHRLTITEPDGLTGKQGVWFVARQHAWEASGSWIAEGLARWLVPSDPQAISLRAKAVVNLSRSRTWTTSSWAERGRTRSRSISTATGQGSIPRQARHSMLRHRDRQSGGSERIAASRRRPDDRVFFGPAAMQRPGR